MRETLERDGAVLAADLLSKPHIEALRALANDAIGARPGARLRGDVALDSILASNGPVGALAARLTSSAARPVRAVMFDKTPEANWIVAWHQDRVIPVRERREVEGFGPWSTKDGVLHVALGSHRLGRVPAEAATREAEALRQLVCLADTADVWAYSTPILHASDRAEPPRRRRVLQVDYADFDLPGGLEWLGVG
ncbi:phytanoyl-CoA dioxygenase [Caulobacter sp. UC70_42]|uniref:phytanoyl-CoA dioxygenase n=1 Tax=Caulobacter sp. UC70_42 TaxID=3374551 RepID=UPI003757FE9A